MATITLRNDEAGTDIVALKLDMDEPDLERILGQLSELQGQGIHVTDRAMLATVLACEAIAAEPPSDWPSALREKNSSTAKALQSRFINSIGYHLFTVAQGQVAAGGVAPGERPQISIFDAIRQAAQLSLSCGCIFRTPPMTPPRRSGD